MGRWLLVCSTSIAGRGGRRESGGRSSLRRTTSAGRAPLMGAMVGVSVVGIAWLSRDCVPPGTRLRHELGRKVTYASRSYHRALGGEGVDVRSREARGSPGSAEPPWASPGKVSTPSRRAGTTLLPWPSPSPATSRPPLRKSSMSESDPAPTSASAAGSSSGSTPSSEEPEGPPGHGRSPPQA